MRYLSIFLAATVAAAIFYFSTALVLSPAPIASEYWVREMIIIKRSLVKQYTGQRKIIVASGSSSLFGIDANQLGRDLGIPVINFGLHAGLPLSTILGEAKAASENGDIVILPLEYVYFCQKEQTTWQARASISWNREEFAKLSMVERIKLLKMFDVTLLFELAQAKLFENFFPASINDRLLALNDIDIINKYNAAPEPTTFEYSAYNLDSTGNMLKIDGVRPFFISRPVDAEIVFCKESINSLGAFIADMKKNDIKVFFVNTPYVATTYMDEEKIEAASKQFEAKLSQLAPILDKRQQLIFQKNLFFNGDLHLNSEGRKIRTNLLLDSIKRNDGLISYIHTK